MDGSSLTDEDLEAALLLIQLISSSSRRHAAVGKSKPRDEEEEESEDGSSTAAAHAPPSKPSSNKKILRRKEGSFGERERELSRSARAQVRRRFQKEKKAAEQLLQLSEEEGGGESCSFNSEASYLTDASSAVAMELETRVDQERGREGKRRGGGGGSKGDCRGLSRVVYIEEEMEEDLAEDECLADIFCRRRKKRKFRPLADFYAATNHY